MTEKTFKQVSMELVQENLVKCGFCGNYLLKKNINLHLSHKHPKEYLLLKNKYYELISGGLKE